MADEGWEARMAARYRERQPPYEPNPEVLAARAAYVAEWGDHVLSPTPPEPPVDPDICRDCCSWGPLGNWPDIYGWFTTCGIQSGGCEHAHHDDEYWIAAA